MKTIFKIILATLAFCTFTSLMLSMCRSMSRESSVIKEWPGYCAPLMLDQAEPLISTRWFCDKEKP